MRTVFESMGTVVSLDVGVPDTALAREVAAIFDAYDARFSLYRPDSELSRVASGAARLADGSRELLDCYARALDWRTATEGAFTPHRPDGVIDLNGIVKAQAIAAAGAHLDQRGCAEWTINAGGDILTSHTSSSDHVWGVSDPRDAGIMVCSIVVRKPRRAMATSGSAQRGDHIWSLASVASPTYVQVTVVADDIVTADVLATAIIAGGRPTLDMAASRFDVDVLTVDHGGALMATPGFRSSLANAAPTRIRTD
jgi:thiamine biosynthesis lipoprotein